ncbi:MAG: hypothetical protein ACJ75B_13380, partial [Flavisolibacter sp.]
MNEDVHNIDDLFREGIESHEEAVPTSVWDHVSHELDITQASFYKTKYFQLKRAARVLTLLCLIGGSYLIYEKLKAKPAPVQPTISAPVNDEEKETVNKKETSISTVSQQKTDQEENPLLSSSGEKEQKTRTERKDIVEKNAVKPRLTPFDKNSVVGKTDTKEISSTKDFTLRKTSSPSLKKTEKQKNIRPTSAQSENSFALKTVDPAFLLNHPSISVNASTPGRQAIAPEKPQSFIASTSNRTGHSFSLTAFAAPNFNFNRLEDDDHLAGPGRDRHTAQHQEQENISMSAGLLLAYEFTNKLRVQSGISFTSFSTTIGPKTVYAKPDNNGHAHYEFSCSSGYVYFSPKDGPPPTTGDSVQTSGTRSKINYVTVPLSVAYRIGNGKFLFYPGIGVGINLLAGSKTSTLLSGTGLKENTASS